MLRNVDTRVYSYPADDSGETARLLAHELSLQPASCFASVSKNRSTRSLALPNSAIAVMVVTGVSAATVTLEVFLPTETALIRSTELNSMKPGFVFALMWWFVSSVSCTVHSRLASVFGMAAQTLLRG